MLFSKACFRKLYFENSVQIQKQNPFFLKLYNKTWHNFIQGKYQKQEQRGEVEFGRNGVHEKKS